MELRLEDLQTEQTHPVAAAGVTLGRDSRRSGIVIADPGVSGAHARIYERAGRYFIEDSSSSNGTFVEGTRLRGELELKDGFVIALHKYKFKVIIDGGSVGDSTALFEPKNGKGEKKPMAVAPTRTQARPETAKQEPEDAAIEDEQIDEADDRGAQRRPTADNGRPNGRRDSVSRSDIHRDPGIDDLEGDNDEDPLVDEDVRSSGEPRASAKKSQSGQAPTADELKAGFAKALAYYMGAVPKMALMPKAVVATTVNEQPFKPMDKLELALWAAPPLALGAIVSLIATMVVGLVTGTFGASTIVSPIIVGAITVVVGSVVAGWAWHPFMTWWVKLLKGESDPQSRTNMMIATFTALSLMYVATGIGALFTLLVRVPVIGPFVQIGPLALMCAASLLLFYVSFVWYGYFRVIHWVPKIIMALGVLTILNAVWGSIGCIRAGIASAGAIASTSSSPSPGVEASGLTAEQKKQLAAAQAAAQAAGLQASATAAQSQTAAQAGGVAAQTQVAAQAQAAGAQAAATNQAASDQAVTARETAGHDAAGSQGALSGKPAPTRVEATDDDDRAESAKPSARADSHEAAKVEAAPRPVATDKPTMAEYNQHIAAIEKMIDDDPSLLSRVSGAMALYKKIHANDAKLRAKNKLDPVSERIRQAELYGANVDAVEELYAKISAP